jgi:hypothetical protein
MPCLCEICGEPAARTVVHQEQLPTDVFTTMLATEQLYVGQTARSG